MKVEYKQYNTCHFLHLRVLQQLHSLDAKEKQSFCGRKEKQVELLLKGGRGLQLLGVATDQVGIWGKGGVVGIALGTCRCSLTGVRVVCGLEAVVAK